MLERAGLDLMRHGPHLPPPGVPLISQLGRLIEPLRAAILIRPVDVLQETTVMLGRKDHDARLHDVLLALRQAREGVPRARLAPRFPERPAVVAAFRHARDDRLEQLLPEER